MVASTAAQSPPCFATLVNNYAIVTIIVTCNVILVDTKRGTTLALIS